jgi:hypothetical protein
MAHLSTVFLAALFSVVLAVPALAWKGELLGGVKSIAEIQEKAEKGDYVVVQGEIVEIMTGNGSTMVVVLEDATGTVYLAVPGHLLREFAGGSPAGGSGPTGVTPEIGRMAQVGGLWDRETLNGDKWGIRVQKAHPIAE